MGGQQEYDVHQGWWNVHDLGTVASQICRYLHQSCLTCRDCHNTIWRVPAIVGSPSPPPILPNLLTWRAPGLCHRRICSCSCGFLYSICGIFCSLCDLFSAPYVPMMIWVIMDVPVPTWRSNLLLDGCRTGDRTISLLLKHRWGLITYCLWNLWAHNHQFHNSYLHHPAPLSI